MAVTIVPVQVSGKTDTCRTPSSRTYSLLLAGSRAIWIALLTPVFAERFSTMGDWEKSQTWRLFPDKVEMTNNSLVSGSSAVSAMDDGRPLPLRDPICAPLTSEN